MEEWLPEIERAALKKLYPTARLIRVNWEKDYVLLQVPWQGLLLRLDRKVLKDGPDAIELFACQRQENIAAGVIAIPLFEAA